MLETDFKIHVERIIRPIRAFASRKLRMRRELLTHLQAAFNEERAAAPDDSTALTSALQRLGDPAQLTRDLQRSVPLLQRLLFARLPFPALERLERAAAPKLGLGRPLTLLNSSILVFLTLALTMAATFFSTPLLPLPSWARDRLFDGDRFLLLALISILGYITYILAMKFASTLTAAPLWPPSTSTLRRGAIIAGSLLLWDALFTATFASRSPTLLEWMQSLLAAFILLLALALTARLITRLQRPHDEWLSLQIAS